MKLQFDPRFSAGNIISMAAALIAAGGLLAEVSAIKDQQKEAVQERIGMSKRITDMDEKLSLRVLDLDKKMVLVLTLLEARSRKVISE